jgi:very-short-patch-repair endonuclease
MTNIMSERARRMRRDRSDAERRLWGKLRALNRQGFHFRQQAPIGPYIADFADHTAKIVIEVDGSQHATPAIMRSDELRTRWLEAQGYRVHRFWIGELLANLDGAMLSVLLLAGVVPPTPDPSPPRGGGLKASPPSTLGGRS